MPKLLVALKVIVVLLICKVCVQIVANYIDYFPPNFNSDFLVGRKASFDLFYRIVFYSHIIASPIVLIQGLLLISQRVRTKARGLHRWLGRIQVALTMLIVVPSGFAMSFYALSGWVAGSGFMASSLWTGICTMNGFRFAIQKKFALHRAWMLRVYVLLCSAVTLRLMGGLFEWIGIDSFNTYRVSAWASWLGPLLVLELIIRYPQSFKIPATLSDALYVPNAPQTPNGDG